MIGFIGTSITIILNYNQLYQFTIGDCLRLAPFLTGLQVSSLRYEWHGSDLLIGHFFNFRFPLVNTSQLSTQPSYEWNRVMTDLRNNWLTTPVLMLTNAEWTLFYNSRRTTSNSSYIGLFHPLPRECVFGEPLASNGIPRPPVVM
jgi:hypothetical protein